MEIYTARNGQTFGPFDLDTINAQLRSGQLLPGDSCWSEGQPVWQALALLDGVQLPAPGTVPTPSPGSPGTGSFPPPPPMAPTTPPPPYGTQPYPQPQPPYGAPFPSQQAPTPYGGQGQPGSIGSSDVETTVFDTSASPLALSMGDIVLGLFCTGGIWCAYVVARNLTTRYKLTNQRLTLKSGLISQKQEEVEVFRIRDVSMEQEVVGRMLGFGDVVVHSSDASSPQIVLKNVPSPAKVKEQIRTASRQGRRSEGVRTGEYMG